MGRAVGAVLLLQFCEWASSGGGEGEGGGGEGEAAGEGEGGGGLWALEAFVQPLLKRFRYHFEGRRETNRRDKPEWVFAHCVAQMRSHAPLLSGEVQPMLRAPLAPLRAAASQPSSQGAVRERYLRFLSAHCPDGVEGHVAAALCGALRAKLRREMPSRLAEPPSFCHAFSEAIACERARRRRCRRRRGGSLGEKKVALPPPPGLARPSAGAAPLPPPPSLRLRGARFHRRRRRDAAVAKDGARGRVGAAGRRARRTCGVGRALGAGWGGRGGRGGPFLRGELSAAGACLRERCDAPLSRPARAGPARLRPGGAGARHRRGAAADARRVFGDPAREGGAGDDRGRRLGVSRRSARDAALRGAAPRGGRGGERG